MSVHVSAVAPRVCGASGLPRLHDRPAAEPVSRYFSLLGLGESLPAAGLPAIQHGIRRRGGGRRGEGERARWLAADSPSTYAWDEFPVVLRSLDATTMALVRRTRVRCGVPRERPAARCSRVGTAQARLVPQPGGVESSSPLRKSTRSLRTRSSATLAVRMANVEIPTTIVMPPTSRPAVVIGNTSPYPTVVIVAVDHQGRRRTSRCGVPSQRPQRW